MKIGSGEWRGGGGDGEEGDEVIKISTFSPHCVKRILVCKLINNIILRLGLCLMFFRGLFQRRKKLFFHRYVLSFICFILVHFTLNVYKLVKFTKPLLVMISYNIARNSDSTYSKNS